MKELAIQRIEQQQKDLKQNSAPWYVGEQLKDICCREPHSAELIAHDLTVADMSIVNAEKKIKEWADKNKSDNCAFVPPPIAEDILRKFYGLKSPDDNSAKGQSEGSGISLDLTDFF